MVRGAFKRMKHHHYFEASGGGTAMRDVFSFESPLGFLGHLVDTTFLTRYMRSFIIERNKVLKLVAESDEWEKYLSDEMPQDASS